jgi:uncharacterized protein YodC (DUF2158 family)
MNMGDIVRLKSGGPLMTVDRINPPRPPSWLDKKGDYETVGCIWFTQIERTFTDEDDDKIRTVCSNDVEFRWFRPEVLKKEESCAFPVGDNLARQCLNSPGYGPDGLYCKRHSSTVGVREMAREKWRIVLDAEGRSTVVRT